MGQRPAGLCAASESLRTAVCFLAGEKRDSGRARTGASLSSNSSLRTALNPNCPRTRAVNHDPQAQVMSRSLSLQECVESQGNCRSHYGVIPVTAGARSYNNSAKYSKICCPYADLYRIGPNLSRLLDSLLSLQAGPRSGEAVSRCPDPEASTCGQQSRVDWQVKPSTRYWFQSKTIAFRPRRETQSAQNPSSADGPRRVRWAGCPQCSQSLRLLKVATRNPRHERGIQVYVRSVRRREGNVDVAVGM